MSERMTEAEFNSLLIRRVNRDGTAERLCSVAHAEITALRAEDEKLKASRDLVLEEAASVADDLGYECEGCGHLCGNQETDMKIIIAAGGLACCPERKMRPLGNAIREAKDSAPNDGKPLGYHLADAALTQETRDE